MAIVISDALKSIFNNQSANQSTSTAYDQAFNNQMMSNEAYQNQAIWSIPLSQTGTSLNPYHGPISSGMALGGQYAQPQPTHIPAGGGSSYSWAKTDMPHGEMITLTINRADGTYTHLYNISKEEAREMMKALAHAILHEVE